MSEINIKIMERSEEGENEVPDEKLSLPEQVYNANWRNDIVDEAEKEKQVATSFEPYENEQEYKSKEIVSQDAENRIDAFDRALEQKYGRKVLDILSDKNAEYERAV